MEAIRLSEMEPNWETVYYTREAGGEILGYLVEKENLGLILENAKGYYFNVRFYYQGESRRYTSVGAALFYYQRETDYLLK